jgi:hypothetical protein
MSNTPSSNSPSNSAPQGSAAATSTLTLPLPAAVRAAYEDLSAKYEAAIEATADVGALEALTASQLDVDNILTKDAEYRLAANTALYGALLKQIQSTNGDLETLQEQIRAITKGVSTFGEILGAIQKVLSLMPGA